MQVLLERHGSATTGPGDISVSEIVEKLGLSQPTVSKHLKVLRDHGLVSVREDGQHRYYSMDADPLETVEEWLIPFLSADVDDSVIDGGSASASASVAAWTGADVGGTLGRRIADGSRQARTVIHDATDKLPDGVRRRLFRDR